jgi:peptidoglycan/LPS O-acetylase OafA/YrhL
VGGALVLILSQYLITWFLFPLTILLFAVMETYRGSLGRRLSFLGDISYSTYMIHFPLQMLFVAAALSFGFIQTLAYSKIVFCVFWSVLLPLSSLTYHLYEKPLQDALRGRRSRKASSLAHREGSREIHVKKVN